MLGKIREVGHAFGMKQRFSKRFLGGGKKCLKYYATCFLAGNYSLQNKKLALKQDKSMHSNESNVARCIALEDMTSLDEPNFGNFYSKI